MEVDKGKQFLIETETVAQEVLIIREEMINLDRRRQKCREAFRALKTNLYPNQKTWMSFGNVFVKTSTYKAENLMQTDMKEIDKEIEELREQLKNRVKKLRDLEGKPELQGFDLKPIAKEAEMVLDAM